MVWNIINGKEVNGGELNQGGIGLRVAKCLKTVFPTVKTCPPYRETWTNEGTHSVKIGYLVPFPLCKAFVEWMVGWSTVANLSQNPLPDDPAIYNIVRIIPYQCPKPGYEFFYVSDIDCGDDNEKPAWLTDPSVYMHTITGDALDKDDGVAAFAAGPNGKNKNIIAEEWPMFKLTDGKSSDFVVRYTVTFTPRNYEVRTDGELSLPANRPNQGELERYVERQFRSAVQNLPLPAAAGYKFADGPPGIIGQVIPAAGAQLIVMTDELNYIFYEWPDNMGTALEQVIGFINRAAWDGARGWRSYPAGTLLMQAPLERKRYRHATGRYYYRNTISMLFRPQGWNYYPASDGKFHLVTSNGLPGGSTIYQTADFNQILSPQAPLNSSIDWRGG